MCVDACRDLKPENVLLKQEGPAEHLGGMVGLGSRVGVRVQGRVRLRARV